VWTVAFGPSPSELYRHEHVFRVIDRPRRLVVATIETRLDTTTLATESEITFEPRDGKTLVTIVQRGLPTADLRDEHASGLPNAVARLEANIVTRRRDLDAMARHVIDANHYMVLGTLDPDGRPRLSPVYYAAARYRDFYWVSSPDAHHTHNIRSHPAVELVIFDSTAAVGTGEAVYLSATAREISDHELEDVIHEAFRTTAGTRRFEPDELRGAADLRLFIAQLESCEVHVPGRHPVHGRGLDSRQAADPTSG
jgi:nitroimidazol reductase NimA-like FMN-containing flavoprotein (pyridoxamine 5'-phosphate oxidase superfamily)